MLMLGYDELGNALSRFDDERSIREVHKQDLEFAAIIRINGAGRIEDRDAMFHSQAASRTCLTLIAFRQCNIKSGRNEDAL